MITKWICRLFGHKWADITLTQIHTSCDKITEYKGEGKICLNCNFLEPSSSNLQLVREVDKHKEVLREDLP